MNTAIYISVNDYNKFLRYLLKLEANLRKCSHTPVKPCHGRYMVK